MRLQFLEFDRSEDTDGVVCWEALAQPQALHNAALLREVSQVLALAYRLDGRGPGPLEEGAQWDYVLDATLHAEGQVGVGAQVSFNPDVGITTVTPTPWHHRIELILSLCATPAFAQTWLTRFCVAEGPDF